MRFPLIPEASRSPEQGRVAQEIVSGPRGELRGPFVPLLYSPELAARIQKVGEYLRFSTRLPGELIELAVLVVARRFRCANMWQLHRALALQAGLRPDTIGAIAADHRPAGLPERHAEIYDFCIQLTHDNAVDDECFDRVAAQWGRDTVVDVVGICGYYAMLAMVFNAADIPLPDGVRPFEP